MAKETKNITPIESVVEELLRDLKGEPAQDFGITLKRLKQQLKTQRVGVLIDNLEPALDKDGKFIEAHQDYVELLSVLADPGVQSVTLITSRERINESRAIVKPYELKGLDEEAWRQYLRSRDIAIDSPALSEMHKAYGGNAKAMEILCGTIQSDYECDLEVYWQDNQKALLVEGELGDLVKSQFDRLKKHDPDAYRLLCRLGCYRYQEIPAISIWAVWCLLWDVPEAQYMQVIKTLQDRSLVEFQKGEYWLHPVIQEESIARMRGKLEWTLANTAALKFWNIYTYYKVNTLDEKLTNEECIQMFYHCLNLSSEKEGNFKEAEKIFGEVGERREFEEFAYIFVMNLYLRAMISLPVVKIGSSLQEEVRDNLKTACSIFIKLGKIEQAEKAMRIIKNGASTYDIAEACYEVGLWHRRFSISSQVNYFKIAILLFEKLGAYEQVEKVRRAMESEE
jgi:hypothetical protein